MRSLLRAAKNLKRQFEVTQFEYFLIDNFGHKPANEVVNNYLLSHPNVDIDNSLFIVLKY